ncbi:MAG TPA: hypothetical protein DCY89_04940 [Gammaproteobacteria bacterium]|nr:hypothetical protein [Gammaproteobacteria bacterium]
MKPALLLITLLWAMPSLAPATESAAPAETRLPDALSDAERADMVTAANAYSECLITEATRHDDEPDPRVIADAAMGACDERLQALGSLLTALRLDPGYAEGFRRQTRDRAARSLLGLIMQVQGQKQLAPQ